MRSHRVARDRAIPAARPAASATESPVNSTSRDGRRSFRTVRVPQGAVQRCHEYSDVAAQNDVQIVPLSRLPAGTSGYGLVAQALLPFSVAFYSHVPFRKPRDGTVMNNSMSAVTRCGATFGRRTKSTAVQALVVQVGHHLAPWLTRTRHLRSAFLALKMHRPNMRATLMRGTALSYPIGVTSGDNTAAGEGAGEKRTSCGRTQ
jgi:hypothetical protein